ncbi:MAG: superoxide dismutase [Candidatus Polarisedimenticolia bacterium]
MKRRDAFGVITMGAMGVAVSLEGVAMAQQPTSPPPGSASPASTGVIPGQHAVKPLPFVAKNLRGLSERLIVSHHDNNYAGAVKNLNKVEEELSRVTADTPGFIVGGLKERELTFTNSMILHELYFGNLGGDGRAVGSILKDLASANGSFARWEEMFRATGMSLSGGSGWTILDFNLHTGDLRTYWSGNHSQALASGCPLLVMDMYEHAYQMDYGAAAAKYVDAFFENIQWDEVNRRLERAQKAAAVLRA